MGKVKEEFIDFIEKLARDLKEDPQKLEKEFYRSGISKEDFLIKKSKK